MSDAFAMPRQNTLTSGLPAYDGSNAISPPTVGIPMLLPYPAMPATTPSTRRRVPVASSDPNRNEFNRAIGRAPIVKMSRMMPPTPVAAPWYGSMNDGWFSDSVLKTDQMPAPMVPTT